MTPIHTTTERSPIENVMTLSVHILISVRLATSPTLVVDESGSNNDDQDNNPSDGSATLFENMNYFFTCSFPASTVDPSPSIRWDLYNMAGTLLHSETDNGETNADCQAPAYSQSYELTANRVTFTGLDDGFLVCTAYTPNVPLVVSSPDPFATSNPHRARINFDIWSKYVAYNFQPNHTETLLL